MIQSVYRGILSTIGETPLVELENLFPEFGSRVFAKTERRNPGGSIEDRAALAMVRDALRGGTLVPGRSTVVADCPPDLAVSLAQVCRYHAVRFTAVVEGPLPAPYPALLSAYGAAVVAAAPGEGAEQARQLVATTPGAHGLRDGAGPRPWSDSDPMREIADALDGAVDHLLCDAVHAGTLRGAAEYVRRYGTRTTVTAVDAGHGGPVTDPLDVPFGVDDVIRVAARDIEAMSLRLLETEGMLAGPSSAAATAALERIGHRIPAGSNCVVIFPDSGDRRPETSEKREAKPC